MAASNVNRGGGIQIIISAVDQASTIIKSISATALNMGTVFSGVAKVIATGFDSVILPAIVAAKDAFLDIYNVISGVDSLLQKFANTTLKNVISGFIDNLVKEISNATNYNLTDVLSSVFDFSGLLIGLPSFAQINDGFKSLKRRAEIELDLIKLKSVVVFSFLKSKGSIELELLQLKFKLLKTRASLEFGLLRIRVQNVFSSIKNAGTSALENLQASFVTLGQRLKGFLSSFAVKSVFADINVQVINFTSKAGIAFSRLQNTIQSAFSNLGFQIQLTLGSAFAELPDTVKLFIQNLGTRFEIAAGTVASAFTKIPSQVAKALLPGLEIAELFVQNLGTRFEIVTGKVASSFTKIPSQIAKALLPGLEIAELFVQNLGTRFEIVTGKIALKSKFVLNEIFDSLPSTLKSNLEIINLFALNLGTRFEIVTRKINLAFKEIAGGIARSLEPTLEIIGLFVKNLGTKFKIELTRINTFLRAFVVRIPAIFAGVPAALIGVFSSAATGIINTFDRAFLSIVEAAENIPQQISGMGNAIAGALDPLSGIGDSLEIFGAIRNASTQTADAIFQVVNEVTSLTAAFDALTQVVATGPYQTFVQQNVELEQQLLEVRSSLTATNKVFEKGIQIKDSTQAILSLSGSVNTAIAKIRKDSLELVGVTSKDLVGVFNIVASEASLINIDLTQAAELTSDFAAALGTIGLPLEQAQQEITSILTAQTDQNSVLAQRLQLSNSEIGLLTQQGKLYDKLREKLEAFRSGNALSAATIGGVTSNIQEIIDEIGRVAGKNLLSPIVTELASIYSYLQSNQSEIAKYVEGLVDLFVEAGLAGAETFKIIFESSGNILTQLPSIVLTTIKDVVLAVRDAFKTLFPIFQPFLVLFTELLKFISSTGGELLKLFILVKVFTGTLSIFTSAFTLLVNQLPIVGNLLYFLGLRLNPLVGAFTGLNAVVGKGAAGFLVLGQNLNKIPFLMNQVAGSIPLIGGAIAGVIPQLSSFAIGLIQLSNTYTPLKAVFTNIATVLPSIFADLATLSASNRILAPLAPELDKLALRTDYLALANEQMAASMAAMRRQVLNMITTTALYVVGITAAVVITVEFFKRAENAGDKIGKLASEMEKGTSLIRSTWDKTRKVTSQSLVPDEPPQLDWVDTLIVRIRQLNEGTLKINNWVDSLVALGAGIVDWLIIKPATGIKLLSETFASLFYAIGEGFRATVERPLEFGAGAKAFGLAWNKAISEIDFEPLSTSIETKAEEAIREIGDAVKSGKITEAVSGQVEEMNQLIDATKNAGSLFTKELEPVKEAIAGLRNGSKNIDDVKNAIASLPDSIPQASRDALVGLLDKEFPNGVEHSRKSAQELSESFNLLDKSVDFANIASSNIRLEELREQTDGYIEGIENEIEVLKKSGQINSESARTLRTLKVQLELTKEAFDKFSDSAKIKPLDLPRLGSTLEQLADIAQTTEEAVKKAVGDPETFKKQSEELIAVTQAQLKMGTVQVDEAKRRFALIAENVGGDRELQIKAQEAITQAYKEEGDKRVENVSAARSEIEARVATGQISELEGEKELTKLKNQELQIQLSNFKKAKLEENKIRAEGLKDTLSNIDKQIESAKQDLENAKKPGNLSEVSAEEKASVKKRKNELHRQRQDTELQITFARKNVKKIEDARKLPRADTDKDPLISDKALEQNQENIIRLKQQLASIDSQITQQSAPKPFGPIAPDSKDIKEAEVALSDLQKRRLTTQKDVDKAVAENNRLTGNETKKVNAEIVKNNAESAKREYDIKVKLFEQSQQKTIDIATEVEAERLIQVQKLENQGVLTKTQAEEQRTKANIEKKKTDLKAEQVLLTKLVKQPILADPEDEEERQAKIRSSRIKTKQITEQLLEDEQKVYEEHIQGILEGIDREQTARQIELQKALNAGLILQEDADVELAAQQVSRLQREITLETKNKDRRQKLELELQQAIAKLRDTSLAKYKAQLDDQNQAYKNQIEVQSQALQRQVNLYDVLGKALENRNRLLEAGRDLAKAATDYATGELDLLASLETSEYRRRKLEQASAAIKLQALKTQQEYELQSLQLQQQQNILALEREQIENRIAQGQAAGKIGEAQAQLAVAKADPTKNKNLDLINALELQVSAAKDNLVQTQLLEGLIEKQIQTLPQLQAAELQKTLYKQKSETSQAKGALINTLPEGQRQPYIRKLQQDFADRSGVRNYGEALQSAESTRNQALQKAFGSLPNISNTLSTYAPYLEELNGKISPEQMGVAITDANREIFRKFGYYPQGGITTSLPANTQPLALPPEIKGILSGLQLFNEGIANLSQTATTASQNVELLGIKATKFNVDTRLPQQVSGMSQPSTLFGNPSNIQEKFNSIFKEASRLSGVVASPDKIPKLVVDDNALKKIGAAGQYDYTKNSVVVTKAVAESLKNGTPGSKEFYQNIGYLVHEIRHALQFKSGDVQFSDLTKSLKNAGVKLTTSTTVGADVTRSVEAFKKQVPGGKIAQKELSTETALETDAYDFQKRFTSLISDNVFIKIKQVPVGVKTAFSEFRKLIDAIAPVPSLLKESTALPLAEIRELEGRLEDLKQSKKEGDSRMGVEFYKALDKSIEQTQAKLKKLKGVDGVREADPLKSLNKQVITPPAVQTEAISPPRLKVEIIKPDPVEVTTTKPPPIQVDAIVPPPIEVEARSPEVVGVEVRNPDPIQVDVVSPGAVGVDTVAPPPIEVGTTQPDAVGVEAIAPEITPIEVAVPPPSVVEAIAPDPISVDVVNPDPISVEVVKPDTVSVNTIDPDPIQVEALAPQAVGVETLTPSEIKVKAESIPEIALQPDAMKSLQLPPASMKQLSVQMESFGRVFVGGVDRLVKALTETERSEKAVTVNLSAPITVNAQGSDRVIAKKTGESVLDQLERVVSQAETISRFA